MLCEKNIDIYLVFQKETYKNTASTGEGTKSMNLKSFFAFFFLRLCSP